MKSSKIKVYFSLSLNTLAYIDDKGVLWLPYNSKAPLVIAARKQGKWFRAIENDSRLRGQMPVVKYISPGVHNDYRSSYEYLGEL